MADDMLTPEQVGELLHVHQETVRVWLRVGTLPGVHVGRRWLVRRADLERQFDKALMGSRKMAGDKPAPKAKRVTKRKR